MGEPDQDCPASRRRQLYRASKSHAAPCDADHDRQRSDGAGRRRRRKHRPVADVGGTAAAARDRGGQYSLIAITIAKRLFKSIRTKWVTGITHRDAEPV